MENILIYILLLLVLLITVFVIKLIFELKNKLAEQEKKIEAQSISEDKLKNAFKDAASPIERGVGQVIRESIKNQQDTQSKESQSTIQSIEKIQQRLTVIDEAQKNINELKKHVTNLSGDIVDVKKIFFDNKQARGSFGDRELEDIVSDSIPKKFYYMHKALSNGKIPDCTLDLGKKGNKIAIDSKFPLPNKLLNNPNISEKKMLERDFDAAIKKHISDVSSKYLIEGETANVALMFVPSHAVFNYINENQNNYMDAARLKNVQICSPSTLWLMLRAYRLFAEGYIMNENSNLIRKEMVKIIKDVTLLSERISEIDKWHQDISDEFKKVKTSSDKIKNKADRLENLDVEKKKEIENS
tara:strand:- start:6074 stop:7144 length:1071 start_codon:yes stop_codon:yes gene_type:complete